MNDKFTSQRAWEATSFGSSAIEHTPADVDLPINVKAVVFDADGTMTFKNADGVAVSGFPVAGGVPLPFVPVRITAMEGPSKCFLVQ